MNNTLRKFTLVLAFCSFILSCEKKEEAKEEAQKFIENNAHHGATKGNTKSSIKDRKAPLPITENLDQSAQLPAPDLSDNPRMPKIQNFENVPEPELDQQMQNFITLFRGMKADTKSYQKRYAEIWNGVVQAGFGDSFRGSDSEIEKLLMNQARKILQDGQVERDELNLAITNSEKLLGRKLTWLATLDSMSGGKQLASHLQKRANSWPPSNLDLAIFYASLEGVRELNPSTNKPVLEEWEPLTKAKNPIYRLIALKASIPATPRDTLHISTEDPKYNQAVVPGMVRFYEHYLNEKHPLILSELIASVQTITSKDSMDLLKKLRENPVVAQSKELKKAIESGHSSLSEHLR